METEELYTENYDTDWRNLRWHTQMERQSTFLGWKNQYSENDCTTKCHLQIQCDPYQITNDIFHRTRTKNFTIHIDSQKTLNSQSSLEKEEWSWRHQPSRLQIILQSYSHQDSMIQKQKYRPTEQDRKPRTKPMHLWVPDFWQRNIQWGKDSLFNKWCWENWTATCIRVKLEHFLKPYTKINSKWIKYINVRQETITLLEENRDRTLDDINQSEILYDPPPRGMEIKTK